MYIKKWISRSRNLLIVKERIDENKTVSCNIRRAQTGRLFKRIEYLRTPQRL